MNYLSMILGLAAVCIGAALAFRRNGEPRQRLSGGIIAVAALLAVFISRSCSSDSLTRQYEAAGHRQGYALGFGLGQHLKQTQAGRRLVILRCKPDEPRDSETIKGLKAGLDNALTIVGERTLELVTTELLHEDRAAQFTPALLTDLKATGADIVVSFAGLATQALWRSPEYTALQWVLPRPPAVPLSGIFREGNVLAMVQEKPQSVTTGSFPAYLEIKGTPAELFNAWFELVTTDEGR